MTAPTGPVIPLHPQPAEHPTAYNPQARWCIGCGVRRSAQFGVLSPLALARIHDRIPDLRFEPGQALFAIGQPGTAAFTVREGVVRLERTSARGDRRIVRPAGPDRRGDHHPAPRRSLSGPRSLRRLLRQRLRCHAA